MVGNPLASDVDELEVAPSPNRPHGVEGLSSAAPEVARQRVPGVADIELDASCAALVLRVRDELPERLDLDRFDILGRT